MIQHDVHVFLSSSISVNLPDYLRTSTHLTRVPIIQLNVVITDVQGYEKSVLISEAILILRFNSIRSVGQ